MAVQLAALIPAATSLISGLFKSKKHYHLYYWDPAESVWKFVLDGHPSQVNPAAASLQKSGLATAIVRNKNDAHPDGTLAPKDPPAGYAASSSGASGFNPWPLAAIAAAGVLGFVLLRKRRRS